MIFNITYSQSCIYIYYIHNNFQNLSAEVKYVQPIPPSLGIISYRFDKLLQRTT